MPISILGDYYVMRRNMFIYEQYMFVFGQWLGLSHSRFIFLLLYRTAKGREISQSFRKETAGFFRTALKDCPRTVRMAIEMEAAAAAKNNQMEILVL